jgi:glycosyltransferase involved in cell wall biosynthesis
MRILQVNTYHHRRGGADVHALALVDALTEAGHDVRFFGMQHPANIESRDSVYWVPCIDFVELNGAKSVRSAVQVLGRVIYSREAARRIGRMIDEWRPDVAHLHGVHHHLSLSVLVELNRRGIPVVWTVHDYKLLCPNTSLVLRGEACDRCKGGHYMQCTLNRCKKDSRAASLVATVEAYVDAVIDPRNRVDRFIAPSRFLLNRFVEFGWDGELFEHIPNFAPDDDMPGVRAPVPGRIAYIGRLDPLKGIAVAIEAVGRTPGVTLEVAGEGPIEDELHALADTVAPGRVRFHGLVGPASLAELRDSSMAAVVPSKWNENSPLTVIEALRRGCPVIGSDSAGIAELIDDGRNGLLFTPGDADALAGALGRLAGDPILQAHLVEGATESAGTLGADTYVSSLLDLYGSVLSEQAAGKGPDSR